MPTRKPKPKIEEVTRDFGVEHKKKADAEAALKKLRKMFFDLISIPESQLARQTIYAECDDPQAYVAALYPKWKIISKKLVDPDIPDEWQLLIQEDPDKKSYHFVNPLDHQVYTRTVAESAPDVDLDRIKEDDPNWYEAITFQPDPPPRELVSLDRLTEEDKDRLKKYLLPVKLTNRMESPRQAKPEEL